MQCKLVIMKNDNFLVIQDFKKKILSWRIVTFFCLISIILISDQNIFNKKKVKFKNEYVARISIKDIIKADNFSSKKLKELEKDYPSGRYQNIHTFIFDHCWIYFQQKKERDGIWR